jgi:predicted O-methyltransferase YrrM
MAYLERIDARDRMDGTARLQRLRQVPAETGRFLALMAVAAPPGRMIEIGASAGYSALWLSLACRQRGDRLTTFEILSEKAHLARETINIAGVTGLVELVEGDALAFLPEYDEIAFCFLDAEKEVYEAFFDLIVSRLVPGGILLADNVISHQEALAPFVERALIDKRLDGLVVPIGKGVLFCRRQG